MTELEEFTQKLAELLASYGYRGIAAFIAIDETIGYSHCCVSPNATDDTKRFIYELGEVILTAATGPGAEVIRTLKSYHKLKSKQ